MIHAPHLLAALLLAGIAPQAPSAPSAPAGEALTFGRFGKVSVDRPAGAPARVAILISGDGGPDRTTGDLTRALAADGALVLGVDVRTYLRSIRASKASCAYAAADFEALSKFAQLKLALPAYRPPVLVGYSSGATLAYATLAEAPPTTFRGAVTFGFCPSLAIEKPLCRGRGLESRSLPGKVVFEPAKSLAEPWVELHGDLDLVCREGRTQDFVARVPGAELVDLSRVGHGFANVERWRKPLAQALARMTRDDAPAAPRAPAVADLPLVEVPAATVPGNPGNPSTDRFAVVLSGDGGWAGIDRDVAGALAAQGIPVVGWNSLSYFWTQRSPDQGARDLARLLRHYQTAWKRQRIVLVGYSFGADVLPSFASRLPADLLQKVDLIALLGPGRTASYEFHLSDWLGGAGGDELPVLPEVEKLRGRRLLCLYGKEEDDSLCPLLDQPQAESIGFEGSHHFGGDYAALASRILSRLPSAARP
ncbi:MAG TPA: AcvB/VirJ family lysyl-phosphatidylglycerol hydrolase [Thermoanaerobaculia bacterium]|nr:AcvB/VirJ family lysyl-phosphatidylglycerol hydrolase [Thermoanaerobaculia bacterium]